MVAPAHRLIEQALQLPPAERRRIAETMWDSLDADGAGFVTPEVEAAWKAEVDRRVAAHERGEGSARDVEEVLRRLEDRHRR